MLDASVCMMADLLACLSLVVHVCAAMLLNSLCRSAGFYRCITAFWPTQHQPR